MLYAYKILTGTERFRRINFIDNVDPERYIVTDTGYVIDDKKCTVRTARSTSNIGEVPVMGPLVYLQTLDNDYAQYKTQDIVANAFIPKPKNIGENYLVACFKSKVLFETCKYSVDNIYWGICFSYYNNPNGKRTFVKVYELERIIDGLRDSFNEGDFNISHVATNIKCLYLTILSLLKSPGLHPELDKLRKIYQVHKTDDDRSYTFSNNELRIMCKALSVSETISEALSSVKEQGISVSFSFMLKLRRKLIHTNISDEFFGYENAYNPIIEEYDDITGELIIEYSSLDELAYVTQLTRVAIYNHIRQVRPYCGVIWRVKDM